MSEHKTAQQRALSIKLAVFDVDGVMTDGRLYFGDDGQEFKAFHSLDGHGLKMLKQSGVALAIITGRTSQVVVHRARNLGIELLYQGVADKSAAFREVLAQTGLDATQVAYMGDDVVDLPVMLHCGLAITVPEAPEIVVQSAHWVTTRTGGMGAVREACELIMRAQGSYERLLAHYLQ